MRELAKKVGSLTLAAGALALVLVNAALNHGCASSQATSAQAEPGRDDLRPPNPDAGARQATPVPASAAAPSPDANAGLAADDDCDPSYMYATKAPVIRIGGCHPGGKAAKPDAKSAVSPSNAAQQAR